MTMIYAYPYYIYTRQFVKMSSSGLVDKSVRAPSCLIFKTMISKKSEALHFFLLVRKPKLKHAKTCRKC